jgi:hypothetical protein
LLELAGRALEFYLSIKIFELISGKFILSIRCIVKSNLEC